MMRQRVGDGAASDYEKKIAGLLDFFGRSSSGKSIVAIILEPARPVVIPLNNCPERFEFGGRLFQPIPFDENQLLFYDWIVDGERITGLELHAEPGGPDWPFRGDRTWLGSLKYVETDFFTRFWFCEDRAGEHLCCEAFGSFQAFDASDRTAAIVVDPEPWLPDQHQHARISITLDPNDLSEG
jgi:hypothetical protein